MSNPNNGKRNKVNYGNMRYAKVNVGEKFTVADMPAMDGVTVLTPAETSLVSVSAGR